MSGLTAVVVVVTLLVTVVGLGVAMQRSSYDVWAAFLVGPALLLLVLPLVSWVGRHDPDPQAARLLMAAAVLKIVAGSLARYAMVYELYDTGDAERYFTVGDNLSSKLGRLDFGGLGAMTGTRFVEVLSGIVQVFTGPTRIGGFMVFSAFAFVGCLFTYRAAQVAFPHADLGRFRNLLFLFPTLVFWPSSIGKDAFMLLCIGATLFGFASVLRGRFGPVIVGGLGLWGTAIVRPHLTLLLLLGMAAALPVAALKSTFSVEGRGGIGGLVGSVVAIGLVLAAAGGAVTAFEERFDLEEVTTESTGELFTEVNRRTSKGGSDFTNPGIASPMGLPFAVVTVLFRPLPIEAGSAQEVVTGLEGLLLLGVMIAGWRRLARLPTDLVRQPMTALAFIYSAGFIVAFVNVENFGILARQRAQLLPLLFLLVAIDPSRRDARGGDPTLAGPAGRRQSRLRPREVARKELPSRSRRSRRPADGVLVPSEP